MTLAERLEWALTHPLTDGREDMTAYTSVEAQPDGNMLMVVLAVDR